MSIRLMTEVWKMPIPSGQKMVLLALCDNANDQGECYPSVSMLTEKCSMSQRSIFSHIDWLEKHGIVSRENRSGRSTIYHIDPCKFCTPANSAPITITEPSIESSRESSSAFRLKLQPEMRILEGVNRQIATDFIALRKAKKSPLTETAVNGIRREAEKLGYTLERALTVCCERGWAGFKADWILRDEAGRGAQSRTQNKQVALEESNRAATAGWVPPEMRGMQHAN